LAKGGESRVDFAFGPGLQDRKLDKVERWAIDRAVCRLRYPRPRIGPIFPPGAIRPSAFPRLGACARPRESMPEIKGRGRPTRSRAGRSTARFAGYVTRDDCVRRRCAALIPYARNARTHSDQQVAQIAASILEFGFTNPVLIDEEDGIIAGGSARRLIWTVVEVGVAGPKYRIRMSGCLANGLIAGHARVLAARQLGIAEIPVMVAAGWTEAQKRAYVLADNQLARRRWWARMAA
jgi:hypothetical protein